MNTVIPTENIDLARAASAVIILDDLMKKLNTAGLLPSAIPPLLIPVYGITWNRRVLAAVTTKKINDLCKQLRNLQLKRSEYDRLTAFFKQAFITAAHLPPEFREWEVLAERFRLDLQHGWPNILATLTFLAARGIPSPQLLAQIESAGLEQLCAGSQYPALTRSFWGITRSTFAPAASSSALMVIPEQEVNALTLKHAVKRHTAQYASTGKLHIHLSRKLKQGKTFAKLGPAKKIAQLKAAKIRPAVISRFCEDAANTNLLKQVRGSLPGMNSAFSCYIAFCELREFPPFPPTEDKVVLWSSVFNDTATFGNYVAHLRKCCFFLKLPTDWFTDKVSHIAKGLKKSQDRSFRFHNFIRSPLLTKLIKHESAESEFAQAAFLSFLFAFRVPSETLQLKRAYRGDQLLTFSPQPDKALIGPMSVGGELFLVAKLSYRKNLPGGCILRRPCFCNLASSRARLLCPIHVFWAAIRRRVDPGTPLFRAVNRGNFNRQLKAIFGRLCIPDADRYSSHGFRRGTAQELKESGSPWAVVASAGVWNSPAFRGYLDMARDVEVGVSRLFEVDPDSESDAEQVSSGCRGSPR